MIDLELILVRDTQQVSKMFGIWPGFQFVSFFLGLSLFKKSPHVLRTFFGTPKCPTFLFGTFLIHLNAVMQYVRTLHLASSVFFIFGFVWTLVEVDGA